MEETPGAELKLVAEQRPEAAARWQDQYPDVEFVSDYHAALERDDVDIVIGTLPHWLHYQAGLDAAKAGKHVFMEKPLALSAAEGREMLDAAKANGVKRMTAHPQRYEPAVRATTELAKKPQTPATLTTCKTPSRFMTHSFDSFHTDTRLRLRRR